MPHANNLDLAVFPAMSKRHSALLQQYSNTVAPVEEIHSAAVDVWSALESSTIARGFVLAHRIAKKVIKAKGGNEFLQKYDFHSSVRADFYNTPTGIKPKTNVLS